VASTHLHGLSEFFSDVAARRLPSSGVFYVRGGYGNLHNWRPLAPNPKLAQVFNGNDDHPGYSDTQISEALLAEEINAIASSPYIGARAPSSSPMTSRMASTTMRSRASARTTRPVCRWNKGRAFRRL
jgi:hypothetical protein